jgi:hypothetical protein
VARVYHYLSKCCNAATRKDPCERGRDDIKENKFSMAGLGKWKCMNCKQTCAVARIVEGAS